MPRLKYCGSTLSNNRPFRPDRSNLGLNPEACRSIWVIGTTYGAGDGTTTFNVPDLRGRVIAGVDNMGGTAASRLTAGGSGVAGTLGAAGGAETHTLTETQMPSHSHKASDPFNDTGVGGNVMGGGSQGRLPSHQYAAQTTYTGGGGAHNNTQPTLCVNYIIRT